MNSETPSVRGHRESWGRPLSRPMWADRSEPLRPKEGVTGNTPKFSPSPPPRSCRNDESELQGRKRDPGDYRLNLRGEENISSNSIFSTFVMLVLSEGTLAMSGEISGCHNWSVGDVDAAGTYWDGLHNLQRTSRHLRNRALSGPSVGAKIERSADRHCLHEPREPQKRPIFLHFLFFFSFFFFLFFLVPVLGGGGQCRRQDAVYYSTLASTAGKTLFIQNIKGPCHRYQFHIA